MRGAARGLRRHFDEGVAETRGWPCCHNAPTRPLAVRTRKDGMSVSTGTAPHAIASIAA